jgi:hypothetical protein
MELVSGNKLRGIWVPTYEIQHNIHILSCGPKLETLIFQGLDSLVELSLLDHFPSYRIVYLLDDGSKGADGGKKRTVMSHLITC